MASTKDTVIEMRIDRRFLATGMRCLAAQGKPVPSTKGGALRAVLEETIIALATALGVEMIQSTEEADELIEVYIGGDALARATLRAKQGYVVNIKTTTGAERTAESKMADAFTRAIENDPIRKKMVDLVSDTSLSDTEREAQMSDLQKQLDERDASDTNEAGDSLTQQEAFAKREREAIERMKATFKQRLTGAAIVVPSAPAQEEEKEGGD